MSTKLLRMKKVDLQNFAIQQRSRRVLAERRACEAEAERDKERKKHQNLREELRYHYWYHISLAKTRAGLIHKLIAQTNDLLLFNKDSRTFEYFDAKIKVLWSSSTTVTVKSLKEHANRTCTVQEFSWQADYEKSRASEIMIWQLTQSTISEFDTTESYTKGDELVDDIIFCMKASSLEFW